MEAVTQWFDGDVKPVHVGPYERKYTGLIRYCMWDGGRFLWPHTSAKGAASEFIGSNAQNLPWRGLAEEPTK